MTPGQKIIINRTEMYFYYQTGDTLVFEYFIEGKQYLHMTKSV